VVKMAIRTDEAPAPVGTYAQATRRGNLVQVAGQVAIDPVTGEIVGQTIAVQTRQVMNNLEAVLEAAGASSDDLLMVRVYLTDSAHFAEFDRVYADFVTAPFPARTTVYVGLPAGLLVQVDALAVLD